MEENQYIKNAFVLIPVYGMLTFLSHVTFNSQWIDRSDTKKPFQIHWHIELYSQREQQWMKVPENNTIALSSKRW